MTMTADGDRMRAVVVLGAALVLAVLPACRKVEVQGGDGVSSPPGGGAGDAGGGLLGGIDQGKGGAGAPGGGGSPGAGGSGGGGAGNGSKKDAAAGGGGGGSGGDAGAAAGVAITDLQVLVPSLNAISVPAVGSDGVSLLQYTPAGTAATLHVDWSGVPAWWYEAAGPRYLYSAAAGTHAIDLLYTASYGIFAGGGSNEISGTAASYKEFLAANDQGFAWVDYTATGGHPGGGGQMTTTASGKVVFQSWSGARMAITDSLRYRARLELSATRVAYVEYASNAPGTNGQVMVQPLSGGPAVAAAASAHHQDRPAVDGDWLVWEEYLGSTDAVIRARNLTTGQVRDLSATTGFRTNPDILGTRVVWEDQRSGNGDIYFIDLGAGGERVAVSGSGHSTAVRLTPDGLVWIESNGGSTGLLRARWAR
jgi:beta propeller repeat protein